MARVPTPAELAPHVEALVAAYNHPRNASLLGHTAALTCDDVLDHYATLGATGGHPLLFFRDGVLAGDGDLRGIERAADGALVGELAFLVAAPAEQGRGLGTCFAMMLHALAFGPLGLARVYAAVLPANPASLRVFEKLGYGEDASATARAYGDPGDMILASERADFRARHAEAMAAITVEMR